MRKENSAKPFTMAQGHDLSSSCVRVEGKVKRADTDLHLPHSSLHGIRDSLGRGQKGEKW